MNGKTIYALQSLAAVGFGLVTSVFNYPYHGQRVKFLHKIESFRSRGDTIKIRVESEMDEQHRQVRLLIIDFYIHGWDSDSLPVEFVESEPYDVEIALNEDWGVTVSGTIRGDEISYRTELPLAPVRDGVAPDVHHGVSVWAYDSDDSRFSGDYQTVQDLCYSNFEEQLDYLRALESERVADGLGAGRGDSHSEGDSV